VLQSREVGSALAKREGEAAGLDDGQFPAFGASFHKRPGDGSMRTRVEHHNNEQSSFDGATCVFHLTGGWEQR
jgi:hypothetical protein